MKETKFIELTFFSSQIIRNLLTNKCEKNFYYFSACSQKKLKFCIWRKLKMGEPQIHKNASFWKNSRFLTFINKREKVNFK